MVQRQSIPAARDKSAGEPAKEEGSNENTPAPAKPTVKALSSKQVKAARKANDKAQFRIDWVRNLQQNIHPSKSRVSEDGSFDEETIRAIAAFQAEKGLGTKKPGLIDGAPERPWRPPFRRLQPLSWGPT